MSDPEERTRLNQAVIEIGMRVFSKHTLEEVMQSALDSYVEALGADVGHIELFTDGEWVVRYESGLGPGVVGRRLSPAEAHIANGVRELGQPVVVEECSEAQFNVGIAATHHLRAVMAAPISMRQEVVGCLVAWTRTAPHRFSADEVTFAGQTASAVALALDNAQLFSAEQQARLRAETAEHDLQQELQRTCVLLRASDEILTTTDPDELLRRLASIVLDATGISRVFVNLVDMRRRVLLPKVASGGLAAPVSKVVPFEQLSETEQRAIAAGAPAVLDYESPDVSESDRAIAEANGARVVLFVPLVHQGIIMGHISLDEPGSRYEFTPEEIRVVASIAAQAASALQSAREAAARAVNLLEQQLRQMAYGLHDGPVQTITAAGTMLGRSGRSAELDEVRAKVAAAEGLLDHASYEMREIMRELRPGELEAGTIVGKIRDYTLAFEVDSGIALEFTVVGAEAPVGNPVQVTLFRVVQEALTNVRKHARADNVRVEIRFGPSVVECFVRDDGRGFDIELAKALDPISHFGLTSMRERMLMIGGDLEVVSAVGEGAEITACAPLNVAGESR